MFVIGSARDIAIIGHNSDIDSAKILSRDFFNYFGSNEGYSYYDIKDRIVVFGGKFSIGKDRKGYNIEMFTKYSRFKPIFTGGKYYSATEDYMIVANDKEYALVYKDENNKQHCKMLLDKDNNSDIDLSQYSDYIEILDDFSQFTTTEQNKILDIKNN